MFVQSGGIRSQQATYVFGMPAGTTTLTSSLNPSFVGQFVTFTATIWGNLRQAQSRSPTTLLTWGQFLWRMGKPPTPRRFQLLERTR